MAKYKVGDKVRIVSERPKDPGFVDSMEKYLGKTLTVSKVKEHQYTETDYYLKEAVVMSGIFAGYHWTFGESWISGLAEPEQAPYTVELRFNGMTTTATLKRGGRDVKTAEARCNPKDTYSRAEGAKIAVERLFEKKREEEKSEIGDRFLVVGNQRSEGLRHWFRIGEIVAYVEPAKFSGTALYANKNGRIQYVRDEDVRPYKENSKRGQV